MALSMVRPSPEMEAVSRQALLVFAAIGMLAVGRYLLDAAHFVWRYFLRPGKNIRRAYGEWAVVTGATDGIGKGYCIELARRKVNVVVHGRTASKVDEVAAELESKYGVKTRKVVEDFGKADEAAFDRVAEALAGIEVGLLVNNCGISYPHAKFFTEVDAALIDDLIHINCWALTKMVSVVLPQMVQRKRGAVINVGSGAATVIYSDPLYAVYAGTKGYVEQFSRTCYTEYKDKGVHFQLQAPLFVATKMAKIRNATLTAPSARTWAAAGLSQLGYEPIVAPYWVHALMWGIIAAMPERLFDAIRFSQSASIRKRALAKAAKEKAKAKAT